MSCANLEELILRGFAAISGKLLFAECPRLQTVVVPTTLTHLGTYTFQNDVRLSRIVSTDETDDVRLNVEILSLPDGTYDFSKCTNLTRFSSSATANLTSYSTDSYIFAGCTALQEVKLPSGFVQVAGYAFDGCEKLATFNFENITHIGRYAFRGTALTKVTLGANLSVNVFFAPFQDCESLTEITIADGNTAVKIENGMLINTSTHAVLMAAPNVTLKSEAEGKLVLSADTEFASSSSLKTNNFQGGLHGIDTLDLSATKWTSIPSYTFADTGFKKVILPKTLTSIDTYAFSNSSLEEIDFNGAAITSIGNYAFQGTSLTTFDVPNTVTTLGNGVFYNCKKLTTVTFEDGAPEGAEETLVTIGAGSGVPKNDGSSESRGIFEDSSVQKVTFARVAKLPVRGFANAKSLTEIVFGDEMTEIGGYYTFYGCESYTSITLPETITTIGSAAFGYSCFSEVVIPGSVTSMSTNTFINSAVVTVTYKDGETAFPASMNMNDNFSGCKNLAHVDLGNRFTKIFYEFFEGCEALETLVIPDGVTDIDGAFKNCTSLSSLTLPSTLEKLLDTRNTFENTPKLKKIVIPEGVVQINESVFAGMTKDQKVCFIGSPFVTAQLCGVDWMLNSDATFEFNYSEDASESAPAEPQEVALEAPVSKKFGA